MTRFNAILSASVLAALSTGAHAIYNPATETGLTVVTLSGASAMDNALFDRVDLDMCQANANKGYLVQSGTSTASLGNYWGVICDANAASGVTGKLLFLKRSAGGSAQGVGPVNSGTTTFIERTSCTGPVGSVYTCAATTFSTAPDGGVSDVNPEAFSATINGGNGTNNYANLTAKEFVTQVFGIVVSTGLRNALQTAQFGTACDATRETQACMPSLSKATINSIFAAGSQVTDWSQLMVNNTQSLVDVAYPAGAPANFWSGMHICRRIVGSGTQAQFQANFLSNTGKLKAASALTPWTQGDTNTSIGPIVWEGSGSGDVENCLVAYDSATTIAGTVANTATPSLTDTVAGSFNGPAEFGPGLGWAIGIQGTEKNNTNAKAYRFIKVDGVAPTLENVWAGKYFDFAEGSCQTRTADTSAKATFIKNLCTFTTATLNKLNMGTDLVYTAGGTGSGEQSWGLAGYLLPSTLTGANPDSGVFANNNPVTNFTRFNNFNAEPIINFNKVAPALGKNGIPLK